MADSSTVLAVALSSECINHGLSRWNSPATDRCGNVNQGLPASLNKLRWYIIKLPQASPFSDATAITAS